jgi:serine/threonine protein kinase/tetratricopeptide (TPR) repeat protein
MSMPSMSGNDPSADRVPLPDMSTATDAVATATDGLAMRYERKAFHARGGIGEVWLGEDPHLGREIALKVLRRDDSDEARARFVAEAQITGQLEHPGIVPVHDVGLDELQRPYYVMKFVHGRTLKEVISHYHSTQAASAAGRQVIWTGLLQTFVDVCHAVAYAHSRGVIHRDLKPSNVMIGEYGETLVVDWGVAKVLDVRRGPAIQTEEVNSDDGDDDGGGGGLRPGASPLDAAPGHSLQPRPPRSVVVHPTLSRSAVTSDGTVLGTPAYMAPEMAEGHSDTLTQQTDVYLLGATLYEILTGVAPREGRSHEQVIELAKTIRPPAARRMRGDCPRALEAICAKAMAMQPQDRYSTAMGLASDVQRYLAGEPVGAYPEPLAARAWRWCKRHRAGLGRAAVAALVLGLSLVAVIAIRHERQLRRREDARRDLDEFHHHAGDALYYAASVDASTERAPYFDLRYGQRSAERALELAERWRDGMKDFPLSRSQTADFRSEVYRLLLLTAQARNARREPTGPTLELLERAAAAAATNAGPTSGYHRILAETYRLAGAGEAAATSAAVTEKQRAEAAPPGPEDWFLDAEQSRQQSAAPGVQASAEARTGRDAALAKAAESYLKVLALEPKHYWAHFQLARCYLGLRRGEEAIGEFGACVALEPDAPWAYSARGLTHALMKRWDLAKADLDHAIELQPDFRPARLNRGLYHRMRGQPDLALDDLGAALAPPADRLLAEAAYYRAQIYLFDKQDYRKTIDDLDFFAAQRPELSDFYSLRMQARLMNRRDGEAAFWEDVDIVAAQKAWPDSDSVNIHGRRALALFDTLRSWPSGPARDRATALADAEFEQVPAARRSVLIWKKHGALAAEVLNQQRRAIDRFTAALKLAPGDWRVYQLRGQCFLETENMAAAQADFARAATLQPDDPAPHAQLGIVLARGGQVTSALSEAAAALRLAGTEFATLHNVACVYAELSVAVGPPHDAEYRDLAAYFLARAIAASPPDFDEAGQIRKEPSFRPLLPNADFIRWLDARHRP